MLLVYHSLRNMDINIIIALLVSLYAYIISEVFYDNKGQIGLFLVL